MTGRRLVLTIGLLVVLAALAVVTITAGDDGGGDGNGGGGTAATGTTAAGPAPDEDVAAALLPATSALGGDWIETTRDDEAVEATIDPGDACPSGPVPAGFLIRSEQRRVRGDAIVETLSVTAGVVAEGATPADLEDPTVVTCLLDGLEAQLPGTSTVTVADGPELAAPPAGATVSHQRYVVTGADGTGGTFDFVLVRRGRAVSLGLLSGFEAGTATDLAEVVAALDTPLRANADRLG